MISSSAPRRANLLKRKVPLSSRSLTPPRGEIWLAAQFLPIGQLNFVNQNTREMTYESS